MAGSPEDLKFTDPVNYSLEIDFNSEREPTKFNRTRIRRTPISNLKTKKCLEYKFDTGGFGNMLLSLINALFTFIKSHGYYSQLYIILATVEHVPTNTIENIIPSIYKVPNIKFGTKADLLEYKNTDEGKTFKFEENKKMLGGNFYIELFEDPEMKAYIKEYIKSRPEIESMYDGNAMLIKKDDINNGIFVHVRYGDMLKLNLECLNQIKRDMFILVKPDYYVEYIIKFYKELKSNIYIFTDTPGVKEALLESFKRMLGDGTPEYIEITSKLHYPEEETSNIKGAEHIFYLLTHCRRAIISDSSLSSSSVFINSRPDKHIIIPAYRSVLIPINVLKHFNIEKLQDSQTLTTPNYTFVKKYKINRRNPTDYKSLTDILFKDDKDNRLKLIADVISKGPPYSIEYRKELQRIGKNLIETPDHYLTDREIGMCANWGDEAPSVGKNLLWNNSFERSRPNLANISFDEDSPDTITLRNFLTSFDINSYTKPTDNLLLKMEEKAESDKDLIEIIRKRFGKIGSKEKQDQIKDINTIKQKLGILAVSSPAGGAGGPSSAAPGGSASSVLSASNLTARIMENARIANAKKAAAAALVLSASNLEKTIIANAEYCTFLNESKDKPNFVDLLNKQIRKTIDEDSKSTIIFTGLRTKIRDNIGNYKAIIEEELKKCLSAAKGGRRSRKNKRRARKQTRRG